MNLIAERLGSFLGRLPPVSGYCVALSGGVDSSVLLDALHKLPLKIPIRAVHINHCLQADAEEWVVHCQRLCESQNIPFETHKVDASAATGESPEAAARQARYRVLEKILGSEECLFTAQHQDDQAETVILQLLRGSGPAGLVAMPEITRFAAGWLARPLLASSRSEILQYAMDNRLQWIEDKSNANLDFDRNYLRAIVMPALQERWPAASKTISRSAGLQGQALELLEEIGEQDLQRALCQMHAGTLSVPALKLLSTVRVRNVLRHWIAQHHLSTPTAAQLEQVLEILSARIESTPVVRWPGACVGRYRHSIYAFPEPEEPPKINLPWPSGEELQIPEVGLRLAYTDLEAAGIECGRFTEPVSVAFRQGGERIKLPGRKHRHKIKKLLQELGVPPWLRGRLPLLRHGTEIIAVLGLEPILIADGWAEDVSKKD